MDPIASKIIADWVIDKANQNSVEFVGGPAVAAVPIIGAVVALSAENISPVKAFLLGLIKKIMELKKKSKVILNLVHL